MNWIFMLNVVGHEKSFITFGQVKVLIGCLTNNFAYFSIKYMLWVVIAYM